MHPLAKSARTEKGLLGVVLPVACLYEHDGCRPATSYGNLSYTTLADLPTCLAGLETETEETRNSAEAAHGSLRGDREAGQGAHTHRPARLTTQRELRSERAIYWC